MKKKLLSMLLTLALVLGLLPAVTPNVHAEEHICADMGGDGFCDVCGNCVGNHDYVWHEESRDIEFHLLVCSICHSENWENHSDNNTDAVCDICGTCMEHDETKTYVWDEESRNDDGHYLVCKDCGIGWTWESHSDGDDADFFCDTCGSCESGTHGNEVWNEIDRDEAMHFSKWAICGAAFGWVEHSDEDGNGSCDVCRYCVDGEHSCVWDKETWDSVNHRLVCKDCRMYCGWESHLDEDNDGCCDTCGYEAHVHTYENGAYHMDSYYHYAMCDTCEYWDYTNYGPHTDEDSNCLCDVCEYSLHQFDALEDLENGTHQGVCTKCGEIVTQEHVFDQIDWDAEGHWDVCVCGTAEAGAEKIAHVYEAHNWYGHNGMHYPECDGCGYHQPEGEAHVDEDDDEDCDICKYWIYAGVLPPLPDDTAGKIIVLMADIYGDGWNGAAIRIYADDTLVGEATIEDEEGNFSNIFEVPYDSTAEYCFAWVEGEYDDECSYKIYVNGVEYTGNLDTVTTYNLRVSNDIKSGTITADKTSAAAGETVTLTIAPDMGYQLESVIINGAEDKRVIGKTTVTFTMPAKAVDISATFAEGVVVYFDNTVSDWTYVFCADGNKYPTGIDLGNNLYGVIVPAGKIMRFTNYMPGMPEAEYPEGYYTTVEFIPEDGKTYSVETLRTIHVKTEGNQRTVSDSSAEADSPVDMILMIAGYRSNRQMVGCQVIENVTGVTEETLIVTGDFIKVFFLKPGTYAPLFNGIVL